MNKKSIKMSEEGYNFLDRVITNRIKLGEERITFIETLELIAKYFREDNESYMKMLKTKMEKEKK
jgi:hypothetical protein